LLIENAMLLRNVSNYNIVDLSGNHNTDFIQSRESVPLVVLNYPENVVTTGDRGVSILITVVNAVGHETQHHEEKSKNYLCFSLEGALLFEHSLVSAHVLESFNLGHVFEP
jgi:hypothetical protein